MYGTLYVVATPIGNLEDITLRALRVLKDVDFIAAEDTRVSRKLLNHFEIKKPLISYYEQNKGLQEQKLLDALTEGKSIALISDAGTPAISDPGQDLVRSALAREIPVVAVPGPSAMLTALVGSGLDTSRFCFEGFLPRDKAMRRKRLVELSEETRTLILYEAPHRLRTVLADLCSIFGDNRPITVGRELTKIHEETIRTTLAGLCRFYQTREPRGEYVLVIAGAEPVIAPGVEPDVITAALQDLLEAGTPRKEAARILAEQYHLRVRDVYQIGLND